MLGQSSLELNRPQVERREVNRVHSANLPLDRSQYLSTNELDKQTYCSLRVEGSRPSCRNQVKQVPPSSHYDVNRPSYYVATVDQLSGILVDVILVRPRGNSILVNAETAPLLRSMKNECATLQP